jgi:hypothetical protein
VLRLLLMVACVSCNAPEVHARDAATDVNDAVNDVTAAETKPCSGHDEDGDGFPDACDTCPAVANPNQQNEKSDVRFQKVGSTCAPFSPFERVRTRLLFDPFRELNARWTVLGELTYAVKDDAMNGGTLFNEKPHMFLTAAPLLEERAVVLTAILDGGTGSQEGGSYGGLIARADATGFLGCYIQSLDEFAVGYGSCTATSCTITNLETKRFPPMLPGGVGLRISVTRGESSGDVECRVFARGDPTSLAIANPDFFIRKNVSGDAWRKTGEAGFFNIKSWQQWLAVDVLVDSL